MKLTKKLLFVSLFLGLGTATTLFFQQAFSQTEETIKDTVKDLRRRNVPPENVAKRLMQNMQNISEKIGLADEEQKKIATLTEKLTKLTQQSTDQYTQSEAHLSLPHIREKIANHFPDSEKYLDIISSAIAKEARFKKSDYVFYHAQDNIWRIPRDLYRKLHERLRPMSAQLEDFEFIRWETPKNGKTAKEFMADQLRRYGFIDDNLPEVKAILLSVNFALFGNVGNAKKCTWEYFMTRQSIQKPSPEVFKEVLDMFGATYKHIDEIVNLGSLFSTKEQTLLQIFIPEEIVDDVAYIAFGRGMPADQQTMNWVAENVERKRKHQKDYPYMQSLDELHQTFKQESLKEKTAQSSIYKELIEQVEQGGFSVRSLLEVYRNDPLAMYDTINNLLGRLTFSNAILTDPSINIKIFHYDAIPKSIEEKYNKKLDRIVDLIVKERLTRAKAETETIKN